MSVQAIEAIRPLMGSGMMGENTDSERVNGPSIPFADVFQSMVDTVRETDADNNEKQYLLATGQLDNPAEATIAATKAVFSVQLLTELRNKALDAYSEIMRISI
ncbi:MAG TPA: flagellar hook-basal body complex protein FliE [Candidatus Flavonifractor merdigallinarum]|uniref:Flagellar hook-basal body complex protein FliE n=1 Tax=Candidatus Flavonifractor merdigallinarum TaxID=2838589 RepID=A0A9D1Y9N1_9FIRM|nr:flagellar hook-basal body complex protein FliE [Candidatus Flavonifractor merdigallinarum]